METGSAKKFEVAKKFNIPQSTLLAILKSKEELKRKFSDGASCVNRKRFRRGIYADVEAALLKWFHGMRAKNIPISGALLTIIDNYFQRKT